MALPGGDFGSVQPPSSGLETGREFGGRTGCYGAQECLGFAPPAEGLYFHSDRGSQYSSEAVRKPLSVIGANQSMSGVGNCHDNATMEAFFSTLKTECFPDNQVFASRAQARREIFEYIEVYYGPRRLHSALGYQTL